jgi:hypothetical protein
MITCSCKKKNSCTDHIRFTYRFHTSVLHRYRIQIRNLLLSKIVYKSMSLISTTSWDVTQRKIFMCGLNRIRLDPNWSDSLSQKTIRSIIGFSDSAICRSVVDRKLGQNIHVPIKTWFGSGVLCVSMLTKFHLQDSPRRPCVVQFLAEWYHNDANSQW